MNKLFQRAKKTTTTLTYVIENNIWPILTQMMDNYGVEKIIILTNKPVFTTQTKLEDGLYATCIYWYGEVRDCCMKYEYIVPKGESYSFGYFNKEGEKKPRLSRFGIREFIIKVVEKMAEMNDENKKIVDKNEELLNRLTSIID